MLLRRGVLAALTALLVAAPSAVALSGQTDPSTQDCVANCSDSSASNEAPTTDTESSGDSGSDDAGNQKGDDGATTPAEPGGQVDGGTGNTGGDNSGDSTIDLCKFEPWNNPRCITDPTVDPPALPSCEVDSTDGETYCSLPWIPCKFKPSTGEKICPPVDPPVDCTTARFASEEAAAAAGCRPAVEPPAPSGIRICKTDKESGERSCRLLERGDYGCFETEYGPWVCVDPAPEPPVLCNSGDDAVSERCDGPIDGGGCIKTDGGQTACYDRVPLVSPKRPVIQPKGKPTADKPPKRAKGHKSRSQSAKAKHKRNAKSKAKQKPEAKRAPARSTG